jgi:hypothetical protein
MLTGIATVDAAVPPAPATVNVHAAVADGDDGAEIGVTVSRSGLGPLGGETFIAAPGAHEVVAVSIVPAGFCVTVIDCGVRSVKLSDVGLAVTPP